MGGPDALLEPHESVAGQLKLVTGLTINDSGKYFSYTGEVFPW